MNDASTTARVYVPVDYIPETAGATPVIFLAGPIQGTGDWQGEASAIILARRPGVMIASPRRAYVPGEFDYAKQVDWETHHLRRAARNGVILFWLAREAEPVPARAYAQTSRFELGEWKMRHERDGVKLVIGIEPGFSGERYIQRRLAQDCPEVPRLSTLPETCERALEALASP
jgi:hypothetical protein